MSVSRESNEIPDESPVGILPRRIDASIYLIKSLAFREMNNLFPLRQDSLFGYIRGTSFSGKVLDVPSCSFEEIIEKRVPRTLSAKLTLSNGRMFNLMNFQQPLVTFKVEHIIYHKVPTNIEQKRCERE